MAELSARVLDTEERTGVLVPPIPPRSGLNLNKRSQVIRMSRRGEQAEKIAASLNLPQREVELLLKVYSRVVYSSTRNSVREAIRTTRPRGIDRSERSSTFTLTVTGLRSRTSSMA